MQRNSFNIFYLVLTIQSKVIDQSLDCGPVLGVLWLLFNPAMSLVEAPDRRHYNRARPVAESKVKAQFFSSLKFAQSQLQMLETQHLATVC